jgi:hypothetical protein
MGIAMMDKLGIDQSRTNKVISWGPDIEFPMVPIGYWTDERIQTLCNNSNNEEEQLKIKSELAKSTKFASNPEQLKIKSELAKSTKFASNPVFQGNKQQESSFTKAVYNKPDLLEVAKRDGANLIPAQQALLFNVLTANDVVFKGGHGHYNGEPVGLKLKDDAKPYHTKPYPIPLKNREVMEHELTRKCTIGALGCLTPE